MAEDVKEAAKPDGTAGKSASKIGTFFEKHKKAVYILAGLFVLIVLYYLVKGKSTASTDTTSTANQNPTGTSPSDSSLTGGNAGASGPAGPAGPPGPPGAPGTSSWNPAPIPSSSPAITPVTQTTTSLPFFNPAAGNVTTNSVTQANPIIHPAILSAPTLRTAALPATTASVISRTAPVVSRTVTPQVAPRASTAFGSGGSFGYSIPPTPPPANRPFGYAVGAVAPGQKTAPINTSTAGRFGYSVPPAPAKGAFGYSVPHIATPPVAKPVPVATLPKVSGVSTNNMLRLRA